MAERVIQTNNMRDNNANPTSQSEPREGPSEKRTKRKHTRPFGKEARGLARRSEAERRQIRRTKIGEKACSVSLHLRQFASFFERGIIRISFASSEPTTPWLSRQEVLMFCRLHHLEKGSYDSKNIYYADRIQFLES